MPAVSCKTGWPGTTPAPIHPGWPGGRRVYRRVGVPSSLAQQHKAQGMQTFRSGETAPPYRQRGRAVHAVDDPKLSWMEWWSHRKDFRPRVVARRGA
jgi:hypothetical protein